jgi:hypothetical protein
MGNDVGIGLLKIAHNHQVARDDICPLFQMGWIKDNVKNPLKFARLANLARSEILVACKPFIT